MEKYVGQTTSSAEPTNLGLFVVGGIPLAEAGRRIAFSY